ncbi:MAG: GGDEF domain-containing protein, partial [Deltaproteobacteria bacterium]|nr:GGDEF domain-containing protein [Deltaproteobacteria bacterium]
YVIRSLAVAPLVMEGKIIGSLNLGDYGEKRFVPSMDTFFLSRLAVIFSLCLMNLIDRERLASLAARDELTGLFNRRELDEALKRAFSSHQRHKKDMALLFIDCDDLKKVNDTHGHDCGDALIRSVAEEIMRIIRKEDMAFRYGGDEFVVLLPDNTESGARHIARRLKAFFNDNPLVWRNSLIPLSVTCGAASTEAGETKKPADLLARADEDLYRNKEERNFAAQENERRRC